MKKKLTDKMSTIKYGIIGLKDHDRPGNTIREARQQPDIKLRPYRDRSVPSGRMSFDNTSNKRKVKARNAADEEYRKQTKTT